MRATTGNRWYAGKRRLLGSQVRAAWNAAAISQMSFFQIPWGGTLAIRRETLAETDLLSKWSQSVNDDLVYRHSRSVRWSVDLPAEFWPQVAPRMDVMT